MLKNRNKTALVYKGIHYTYEDLLQNSQCYANAFAADKNPEKILIYAENSPEWCFALYGALRCNATVVPVDVQSTSKEISYIIEDCRPDIIFVSDEKRDMFTTIEIFGSKIVSPSEISIREAKHISATEIPVGNDDDTLFIIYTSGTTGSPKGVMLSYKNIFFNIDAVSKSVPIFQVSSNVMVLLPLHHIFPLMGTLIIPLYTGGTLFMTEGVNAESILKTLSEGKISLIIGVPRLYDMLVKGILDKINASKITQLIYKIAKWVGNDAFSKLIFKSVHKKFGGHVQYLVSGGAALSLETASALKTLGFYVLEGYGMTEAAPMISFTRPGKRKLGYTGEPLLNVEIAIADNGEICVKGDNVMQGYYGRKEETLQILKDRWLHTGDVGLLDESGIKITGRIKEIIVTPNGKNINPELLERDFLQQSKGIQEIGIFMHENILQAMVRPLLAEIRDNSIENMNSIIKEQIALFNSQNSAYKRIKRFHIISEELPKTRLGKIQRFRLPSLIESRKDIHQEDDLQCKSETYRLLKKFIDDETGMYAREHDHFEIDLSLDSLGKVSLLAYAENAFGVGLDEERIEELNTLAKLSAYIESQAIFVNDAKTSWKEVLATKVQIKLSKPGIIHWCVNYLFKMIFFLAYRFSYKGTQNLPKEPCIIVANHRSALDGLFVTYKFHNQLLRDTFFFAKKKHWKTRFSQFMARKNNIILMDINKNVRESLQQMSAVLRKGKNVVIFPEGTRSKGAQLNKFKETFAILSQELNVPIVPIVITGSEQACYQTIQIPRLMARINVNVLKPIYPINGQSAGKLRDKVANMFRKQLEYNKRNK